jgi:hypothetical protein
VCISHLPHVWFLCFLAHPQVILFTVRWLSPSYIFLLCFTLTVLHMSPAHCNHNRNTCTEADSDSACTEFLLVTTRKLQYCFLAYLLTLTSTKD